MYLVRMAFQASRSVNWLTVNVKKNIGKHFGRNISTYACWRAQADDQYEEKFPLSRCILQKFA